MFFYQIIARNLRQRVSRTVMTVAGLAVAVMAITTLWNTVWGYAEASGKYYSSRGVDIVVVRAGISNRLTSSLHAATAARLAEIPGVAGVDASLTEMVSLGGGHLIGIPLRGLAPNGFEVAQLPLVSGRKLTAEDHGVALIGKGIADSLPNRDARQIEVEGTTFQVVGVFDADNPYDANTVVTPLDDVQKLLGRPGVISEFQLRVRPSVRSDPAIQELCRSIESLQDEARQPLGLKALSTRQFVNSATEVKLGGAMAWATSTIVLSLSLLGMLNTMLMSVVERTREIGVLRAIGWSRRRVMRMVLGESLIISLISATIGMAAAWALIQFLSRWPTTSLLVPPDLSVAAFTIGFAAVIVAGVAGTFYPAFHAASIPPTEALRYE
jgi:putative ABC transport system permease protein